MPPILPTRPPPSDDTILAPFTPPRRSAVGPAPCAGRAAAIRVGGQGALVPDRDGLARAPVRRATTVADKVGAGDGFAAGFAYGLLHGWTPAPCAAAANLIAAAALTGTGDWETLPRLEEVAGDLEPLAAPP